MIFWLLLVRSCGFLLYAKFHARKEGYVVCCVFDAMTFLGRINSSLNFGSN